MLYFDAFSPGLFMYRVVIRAITLALGTLSLGGIVRGNKYEIAHVLIIVIINETIDTQVFLERQCLDS